MTDFSAHLRTLARGPRSRRDLNFDEAFEVMTQLLDGRASREQACALLVALRIKGETSDEFAGLVAAARQQLQAPSAHNSPDIDWPCYSGKKRQPLWFLLSARLLATNGFRILLHDAPPASEARQYMRQIREMLDIPSADSLVEADTLLAQHNIVWLGLEDFAPPLVELLALRQQTGVRSIINSLVRCLNPLNAGLSLQSVFHPHYLTLHSEVASQLGDGRTLIFKGDGGEAEIRPYANSRLLRVASGECQELTLSKSTSGKPAVEDPSAEALLDLWEGRRDDAQAQAAVVDTTAAILWANGTSADLAAAHEQAERLWSERHAPANQL